MIGVCERIMRLENKKVTKRVTLSVTPEVYEIMQHNQQNYSELFRKAVTGELCKEKWNEGFYYGKLWR